MEKTTVAAIAIIGFFVVLFASVMMYFANIDNNKEKELVKACIMSGGEPQYDARTDPMRGCDRG